MHKLIALTVLVLVALAPPSFAQVHQVFVSTVGQDNWSGKQSSPSEDGQDGPFRTLGRAAEWIADIRAEFLHLDAPLIVSVRGGFYSLEQEVVIDGSHSGTSSSPTVFRAFQNEKVVLSGGSIRNDWQLNSDGQWELELAEFSEVGGRSSRFYIDGKERLRESVPVNGFFEVDESISKSSFRFKDSDFGAASLGPVSEISDVEVLSLHTWSASLLRIKSIDWVENIIQLSGESVWPFKGGKFNASGRFRLENVYKGRPTPSRWWMDTKQQKIFYTPMARESLASSEAIFPQLDRIILIKGDRLSGDLVRHVVFDGFEFAYTNWSNPSSGYAFAQSDLNVGAAIEVYGAEQVSFRNCKVRATGGHGIAFGAGSAFNAIERCSFSNLGGGGVLLGYAGRGSWGTVKSTMANKDARVSNNMVCDSKFSSGGRLHLSAPAIWIGESSENIVMHNEISEFTQNAISVGWSWGFEPSVARDNLISYNRIHDIGLGLLSDLAGVYLLGPQPGTIVRGNHVSDIRANSYGGWGLYADEGTSEVLFEQNLVHDTTSGSFHQHYGANNLVRNNIFAFAESSPIEETRVSSDRSFLFDSNIVYWSGRQPAFGRCHRRQRCDVAFESDGNIYWGYEREPTFPGGSGIEIWRESSGQDLNSILVDPQFLDPDGRDFRLADLAPEDVRALAATEYLLAGPRTPEMSPQNGFCGLEISD